LRKDPGNTKWGGGGGAKTPNPPGEVEKLGQERSRGKRGRRNGPIRKKR